MGCKAAREVECCSPRAAHLPATSTAKPELGINCRPHSTVDALSEMSASTPHLFARAAVDFFACSDGGTSSAVC